MKKAIIMFMVSIMVLIGLSTCKKSAEVGREVGSTAPNVIETDSQGAQFNMESLRGRVILLNFCTMWCGPCREEVPDLIDLYNRFHSQGLEIVQCLYQDEDMEITDLSDLARWIQEYNIPFTVITDPDSSAIIDYNAFGYPRNVIIDRDFIIQHVIEGFYRDQIIQAVESFFN
jgi:peroxiredoxin